MLAERTSDRTAGGHQHHHGRLQSPRADRQLADRVAIGVHHEGAVRRDLDFSSTEHVNVRQFDMCAFEHPRHHAGEETHLAHVLAYDDIEKPVIE